MTNQAETPPISPLGEHSQIIELQSTSSPGATRLLSSGSIHFEEDPIPERENEHRRSSARSAATNAIGDSRHRQIVLESINHHEGIYWRSPISMVTFFLLGILASVMHHFYYHMLDGDLVGNDREQQWALRWGTTFAYIAQASLVTSMGFAYTQWLWWTLKKTRISIAALDAAFGADYSLASLLNMEMIQKIKVGSLLALTIGLLPLTSLVPPATLSTFPSLHTSTDIGLVRVLDINGPFQQQKRFQLSANSTDNSTSPLLSPRTIIKRLVSATATQGEILSIHPPFSNVTFSLQFYGPSVSCGAADNRTSTIIDHIRDADVADNSIGNRREKTNYYYAFVPDLITNASKPDAPNNGVLAVSQTRPPRPQNASNQIWMAYSRYDGNLDAEGHRTTTDYYMVCKLFNTSHNIQFAFEERSQIITDLGSTKLNEVNYPDNNAPPSDDLMRQHSYSAVFWAMSDLLVGSMGFFNQTTDNKTINFTEIATSLQYISLIGSSDLRAFIDSNHPDNNTVSDQRAQDIALTGNRTLEALIPELMFNITASFMTSDLLSPPTNMTVTRQDSVNKYSYHYKSLLLSYGLAIGFALVANLLGAYAYWDNGVSHNKAFSAILSATRHHGLTELFHYEIVGRLPLSKRVREALVQFGPVSGRRGSLGDRRELGFMRVTMDEEEDWVDELGDWLRSVRWKILRFRSRFSGSKSSSV